MRKKKLAVKKMYENYKGKGKLVSRQRTYLIMNKKKRVDIEGIHAEVQPSCC